MLVSTIKKKLKSLLPTDLEKYSTNIIITDRNVYPRCIDKDNVEDPTKISFSLRLSEINFFLTIENKKDELFNIYIMLQRAKNTDKALSKNFLLYKGKNTSLEIFFMIMSKIKIRSAKDIYILFNTYITEFSFGLLKNNLHYDEILNKKLYDFIDNLDVTDDQEQTEITFSRQDECLYTINRTISVANNFELTVSLIIEKNNKISVIVVTPGKSANRCMDSDNLYKGEFNDKSIDKIREIKNFFINLNNN